MMILRVRPVTAKPEKVCPIQLSLKVAAPYGKTREGVPNQLFFEGRRSLGSLRLKCGGFRLRYLWFCYSSRTFRLNRITALAAIRRFGFCAWVRLKPRNLRSAGRATALFCSLTLSLSLRVMKPVMLRFSRSPAARLRT